MTIRQMMLKTVEASLKLFIANPFEITDVTQRPEMVAPPALPCPVFTESHADVGLISSGARELVYSGRSFTLTNEQVYLMPECFACISDLIVLKQLRSQMTV